MAESSDSMGMLVEDMVAPNGKRIAEQIFGDDPVLFQELRVLKKQGSETMELDLVVAGERHVMVVEAKRHIRPENPRLFLRKLERFEKFFQSLRSIASSLFLPASIFRNQSWLA